ncbi:rolling circle replication-associated protein, partial [Noviherbaspirillum pedocola]
PYSSSEYSGRAINYPLYEKPVHFRAKVQEFSGGGFEVVISSVNLQRHADRASMHVPRGPRTERKGDQESIEKARRRAKRSVRLKVKEMGADHLITFTTRATISRDELKAAWGRFTDNVSYHMKRKFEYVCVCEPHPTNPDHLHLHAAIRGRLSSREMVLFRRCWYIALGATGKEKGAAAPGGFNIRHIRVKGGAHRRMDKIASYISKYITKEDCAGFNKKRYWASKINLKEARAYWLKAVSIKEAVTEFCREFDFVPADMKQDFFQARNIDLAWMRCVPDPGGIWSHVPF